MADSYKPELTPGAISLWFEPPPVCHPTHWARLKNRLIKIERVYFVRIDFPAQIKILYSRESEYLAAVAEVDALLRYFNKPRFAKPV